MNDSKPPWEVRTADSLCNVSDNLHGQAQELRNSQLQVDGIRAAVQTLTNSIECFTPVYDLSRGIVTTLAYRQLDFEIAFAREYLTRILRLDQMASTLSFSGPGFTFEVHPPVELLLLSQPDPSCDRFRADQLGVRSNGLVTLGGSRHDIVLHFAIGFDLSKTRSGLYLAGRTRIEARSQGLDQLLMSSIETAADARLSTELANIALPTIDLQGLADTGLALKQITSRTTLHTSLLGTVIALPGNPPIEAHQPSPPLSRLDPWMHSAIRMSPYLVLTLMKMELRRQLASSPVRIRIEPLDGAIIVDTSDPSSDPNLKRRLLTVRGPAWCINEFNDREDYGVQTVFASLGIRTPVPNVIEVYLDTRAEGSILGNVTVPKPTLMRLVDAERAEPKIYDDVVSIGLRYRV
jgi:hypothetical protein